MPLKASLLVRSWLHVMPDTQHQQVQWHVHQWLQADCSNIVSKLRAIAAVWSLNSAFVGHRQMFVNHRLARIAAGKELQEAQARINVQEQLATAQQQAAQRNITVAREKAANEAKSEFMSLMCHEVRTPLNGCLASAEMLLEMPLQVTWLQKLARSFYTCHYHRCNQTTVIQLITCLCNCMLQVACLHTCSIKS